MIVVNESLCDLCGTCIGVCPQNCMELFETRIIIDNEKCIECLNCVDICPFRAINQQKEEDVRV
ncbi:MAG: 4Fe-4S binding protein [Candidatus Marinimicrobia bacterium]|nr:4Fe-4S binding protein [Candidatus Neomarinimicrobiota bacterium]